MPVKTFLILLVSVITAAAATLALVFWLGINLAWLGLVAILVALAVRRWA